MRKKKILNKAAVNHIKETLGNTGNESKIENIKIDHPDSEKKLVNVENSVENFQKETKSIMKLEDYTKPEKRNLNLIKNKAITYLIGFFVVVFLLWSVWPSGSEIYFSRDKMTLDNISEVDEDLNSFESGQDFFIFYLHKNRFWRENPTTLTLTIYQLDGEDPSSTYYSMTRKVKKDIKKFQTYYDESFFDQKGEYLIEFKDQNGTELASKKFRIQ